jgi:hypothetical protein
MKWSQGTEQASPAPADWRTLAPVLLKAVDRAEAAAKAAAIKDLDAWRAELLAKAEADFIPYQDDYIRRRLVTPVVWAKDWLFNWFSAEAATQAMNGDVQAEFAKRVASPEAVRDRLGQIAVRAGETFQDTLAADFDLHRQRQSIAPAAFNEALLAVIVEPQRRAPSSKAIQHTFKLAEIALKRVPVAGVVANGLNRAAEVDHRSDVLIRAYTNWQDLSLVDAVEIWSMAKVTLSLAAKGQTIAAGAAGTAKALAAGKVTVATAGLGGVVIAAGVVGYDLYDHFGDPAPRRKVMRDTIEATLKAMMDHAVTEDGFIGAGLSRMATGIRDGLAAQAPEPIDLGQRARTAFR